jgi:hypothetical protein
LDVKDVHSAIKEKAVVFATAFFLGFGVRGYLLHQPFTARGPALYSRHPLWDVALQKCIWRGLSVFARQMICTKTNDFPCVSKASLDAMWRRL